MNINEIAKLAGVSRATVSRFLNDGYVSEDKKEKIRKVIEETGYKPSAQAPDAEDEEDESDRGDYPEDQFRIHQPYGGGNQRSAVQSRLPAPPC